MVERGTLNALVEVRILDPQPNSSRISKKSLVIRDLLQKGFSYKKIIEKTGAAKSTIHFHAKKLGNPNKKEYSSAHKIAAECINSGESNAEVIRRSGLSLSTIYKIRRDLDIKCRDLVNWDAVQAKHDGGMRRSECLRHFGFSAAAWTKAVDRGVLISRSHVIPFADILVEDSSYSRGPLKIRLINEGLLENICSECRIGPEWNGKPLVLTLDHINGKNRDNRISNLRLLCPNCHSQTDTFAGRNSKKTTSRAAMVCLAEAA